MLKTLAITIAALLLMGASSPAPPPPQSNTAAAVRDTNTNTNPESAKGKTDERIANYTFWLMIFTGVLAVVSSVQIFFLIRADRTAARATKIAEQAMIAAHRAYILCEGYHPLFEPISGSKDVAWRFRPIWRNNGDLPANTVHYAQCEVRTVGDLPPGYDFPFSQSDAGTGLINPKAASTGGQAPRTPGAGVETKDVIDIQAGRKRIFLWGWVRYSDGFPNTPVRTTHFCFVLVPVGNPRGANGPKLRWDYVQYTQGNYVKDQ